MKILVELEVPDTLDAEQLWEIQEAAQDWVDDTYITRRRGIEDVHLPEYEEG